MAEETMTDERALEIAIAIEAARYRALGTHEYMAELKTFSRGIDASEDEMLQFIKRIYHKMNPSLVDSPG